MSGIEFDESNNHKGDEMKIENLTEEQEAMLPVIAQEWEAIGMCTEPANRGASEKAMEWMYTQAGLAKPTFEWFDSPRAMLARRLEVDPDSKGNLFEGLVCGQHEAPLLAFYWAFRKLGFEEETDPLKGMWDLARNCGWTLPWESECWMSERPCAIRMMDGALHCEDAPAIEFPDGWGVYALNGIRVPQWLVMTPAEEIDLRLVTTLENAEIRREAVRKVTVERLVEGVGATVIDRVEKDTPLHRWIVQTFPPEVDHEGVYELIEFDPFNDGRQRPFLKMLNPSIRTWHVEGVPPGTKTIVDALAFKWDCEPGVFPEVIS